MLFERDKICEERVVRLTVAARRLVLVIMKNGVYTSYTLVLHKISSPGAYRAVYKALHGVFTGLSLVILSEIQKK